MWQIIKEIICLSIAVTGTFLFGRIVLNKKIQIDKKRFAILFTITILSHALLSLYLEGFIKTLLMGIIEVYFYIIVFQINKKKSILLTITYMMVLIIPDLLELFFVTKILKMDKKFA